MLSEAKMMKRIEDYKAALAKKSKDLGEVRKGSVPGTVVAAGPVVTVASAALFGELDGRMGTAQNQHPASIAGGVVGVLGAIGLALMGKPVAASLVADAASGPIAGLAWAKGYDHGRQPAAAG